MPRALTIQRTTVPASERERYFERLSAARAYYESANCRFWAFEEAALPGAFVEFTEATDPQTLVAAHAGSSHRILDAARVYLETEIP